MNCFIHMVDWAFCSRRIVSRDLALSFSWPHEGVEMF